MIKYLTRDARPKYWQKIIDWANKNDIYFEMGNEGWYEFDLNEIEYLEFKLKFL